MDRNGHTFLTCPATPKAFKVSGGRYSFRPERAEESEEVVDLPPHLRTERVTVPSKRT